MGNVLPEGLDILWICRVISVGLYVDKNRDFKKLDKYAISIF